MDEARRELERRAKDEGEWRARAELARVRVHLGELELVGETDTYLVVRDGDGVRLFPLDPPNTLEKVLRAVRKLGLEEPLTVGPFYPGFGSMRDLAAPLTLLGNPPRWGQGRSVRPRIVPRRSDDPCRD